MRLNQFDPRSIRVRRGGGGGGGSNMGGAGGLGCGGIVVVLIGADTNSFAYLGRRSTGTKARTVAIVGPDWNGAVPAADQTIRCC